jgi:DNA-directed RNA polymerase subunit N (RpoN/RPB10)
MLYVICPTCGMELANRIKPYEEGLREIEDNPNNDEQLKLELKEKLVNSLEIERYCCRMRLITYKDKTEIFK